MGQAVFGASKAYVLYLGAALPMSFPIFRGPDGILCFFPAADIQIKSWRMGVKMSSSTPF